MPRVSILVTCYNHLAFLPSALAGVLNQSFADWEAIILDDGSTDGTREYLSSWREGLPTSDRVKVRIVFNDRNLGTYGTLNAGLDCASGEVVAVLNDDDVWLPRKLELQVALLDAHPEVALVHTNGWFIGPDGERLEGNPLGFDFPQTESGDLLMRLIYSNSIIASAVALRASCFEELGRFDERYFGSGDWDMWLRVAERHSIGYLKEPLTLYRWHGSNASKRLDRIWLDDERLRERIVSQIPFYRSKGYPERDLVRALAHNWACLGTVRTLNGNPKGGRAAYRESMRLLPGRGKSALRWLATFLPLETFKKLA